MSFFTEFSGQKNKEISEEERKAFGYDYLAGVDLMFYVSGERSKEERDKVIRKANEAREMLFDKTEGSSVIINEMFVGIIKDRLKADGGFELYLGQYKELLEEKFGILKETNIDVRNRIHREGEEAAEKLFVSRNPKLIFE
jgi:hypothetical protein